MSHRRTYTLLVLGGVVLAIMLAAVPAAHANSLLEPPELNPKNPLQLPSIASLLHKIVGGLFGALLSALTPSFLRDADIDTIEWLVALPNMADSAVWPHVAKLEQDMVWIAGAVLPLTLVIATVRDSALAIVFRAHPANGLLRFIGAVFWIVLYRFSVRNGIALVNTITHTLLSLPVVAEGLHSTLSILFGGSVLTGLGGAFLALLTLVIIVFAVCMFALKVGLLIASAALYIVGPFFIGLMPLPMLGYLARGWVFALVGVCMVPVGWCVIFATAGAISLDVTDIGTGPHISSRLAGMFAALAVFYLAYKWPLVVLRHVLSAIGGLGGMGIRGGSLMGGGGGGGQLTDGALAAKAKEARGRLHGALMSGGRGLGFAAAQFGAPQRGLVGVAKGDGRRLSFSAGENRLRSPRPSASFSQRLSDAGRRLRETPGRMREGWRTGEAMPRYAEKRSTAARDPRTPSPAGGNASWTPRPGGPAGRSSRPSGGAGRPGRGSKGQAGTAPPTSAAATRTDDTASRATAAVDRSRRPGAAVVPSASRDRAGGSPRGREASTLATPTLGTSGQAAAPTRPQPGATGGSAQRAGRQVTGADAAQAAGRPVQGGRRAEGATRTPASRSPRKAAPTPRATRSSSSPSPHNASPKPSRKSPNPKRVPAPRNPQKPRRKSGN